MSRYHTDRTDNAVNMSGTLKEALPMHAYERCRHFFSYVYTAKLLTDHVNTRHNLKLKPTDVPEHKATEQVDSGLRSTDAVYFGFNAKDPAVVDKSATGFSKLDAAHFCNLGIDAGCRSKFGALAGQDEVVARLFMALITFSGNTRWLPQRINIGPDRIIDNYHYELAIDILSSGKPPISKANLKRYLTDVDKALKEYGDKHNASGNVGLAACVDAYRVCYASAADSLWSQIYMNALGECRVVGANQDDYVTMT